MKNNGKTVLQGSALALALCFAQVNAGSAQEPQGNGPEFNANFALQGAIGGQTTNVNIPIDCDLLGSQGQKTLEFVKQFGIWGHIANETDIDHAERHLRIHGITPERIEGVRQHCIENYL
jgi:hypothetical protein